MKKLLLSLSLAIGFGLGASADTYKLVTDASTLSAGDKIIIVNVANKQAMSTTQNTNNRGIAAVTITDNVIEPGTDVQVITLEEASTANQWNFNVETGYLYAASSSSNYLKTADLTSAGTNANATISIDSNGSATIKFQGTYTRNWLKYNSSSKIFSCYSSGQQDVAVFKAESGVEDNRTEVTLKWEQEGSVVSELSTNLGETFAAPTLSITPSEAASEVIYSSSVPEVADFVNGSLEIKGAGKTTILAAISDSENYRNASAEYILNVEDPNAPKPDYIVDELTMESFTSASSTSYNDYFCTSTVTGITYYAQMASGNNSIQLRSKNSNSGIVVTENNNKYVLVSVEVEWNSNTSINNELDFYGKETGYVSPANLYSTSGNTEQGTELGKVVYGTSTSIEIENPYEFIGMRSKSGAIYINKITLKWKKAAPVAPEVPALSIDGNELADDSYTTSNDSGSIEVEINVPEGHEVYYKLEETAANVAAYAAEEGYTLYTDPITVSGNQTLSYYAVNTATGVQSATREIAFHITTGIEGVEVDAVNGVVEYFNLHGVKVEAPANGLYIRRQGAKVEKVIVK